MPNEIKSIKEFRDEAMRILTDAPLDKIEIKDGSVTHIMPNGDKLVLYPTNKIKLFYGEDSYPGYELSQTSLGLSLVSIYDGNIIDIVLDDAVRKAAKGE